MGLGAGVLFEAVAWSNASGWLQTHSSVSTMQFQAMAQVPSTAIASEPSGRFGEVPTRLACQQMDRPNFPANWALNWHTKSSNNFILKSSGYNVL
jgi:hypothetical protein